MNEVRIVGNDVIISVDEVVANMENAALIEDNKHLQAENAKLRELVRDTIPYVDCHLGSDECVHLHECHGGDGCVFERLAHELGVDA